MICSSRQALSEGGKRDPVPRFNKEQRSLWNSWCSMRGIWQQHSSSAGAVCICAQLLHVPCHKSSRNLQ